MPCHSTSSDLVNSASRATILLLPRNTSHSLNATARERCRRENQIHFLFICPDSPFRHKRVQSIPALKLRLKTRQGQKGRLQRRLPMTWIRRERVPGWRSGSGIQAAGWDHGRETSFTQRGTHPKGADTLGTDSEDSLIFNIISFSFSKVISIKKSRYIR